MNVQEELRKEDEKYAQAKEERSRRYKKKVEALEREFYEEEAHYEQKHQRKLETIRLRAKSDSEKYSIIYKENEQLIQDAKNYAKTEEGRLRLAELERQEKIASWRAQGFTEEEIRLKSMNKAEYVEHVNKEARKESESMLEKLTKKTADLLDDIL